MLKEKVVKALAWQSGAKLLTQMFSFGVTILLARMLLPEDFGLVGMALVFTRFIDLINEMGIGSSIIRRQGTSSEELSSVFWFAILVGCGLYGLTFFAAPLVGNFFQNEAVTSLVRILGLNLIIGSLRTVPFSLLTRDLHFAQRSRAEILAAMSGGCIALLSAFAGLGVWSLVLNSLASGMTLMVLCFRFSHWRPLPEFRFALAREMVSFGAKIMGTRMQWYAYSNADYFIIGRILGKAPLGHYTIAFNLAMQPLEKITAIVNQVMFPTFSKLQDNRNELRNVFLKTTQCVSLMTFPLLSLLAFFSPQIVTGLLTEKWISVVFPLRALCLVGLIKSIDVIIPQMLLARGKASFLLKYSTLLLCILPAAFVAGCYFDGIDGVAYAWMLAYPPLVFFLVFRGLKELEISFATYLRNLLPQSLGVVAMVGVLLLAKGTLMFGEWAIPPFAIAVIGGICGFIVYGVYLKLFHSWLIHEMIFEIRNLRRKKLAEVHI